MQKLFAFYFLALTSLLTACSPNSNLQGKGESYLQGQWKQDSIPMQKQLMSYSLYNFKFTCDSVFMQISSFSKVNSGADSCMNTGKWEEYIRGTYTQHKDTLHIKGNFCNADYSLKKQGGCFRSGPYEELFKVEKKNDSLIQFLSTSNVIPVNLRLIKKISCTPNHCNMKLNIFKKIALGIAIIYAPLQSMAWGTNGHRISGQIADDYLTPKARAGVYAILGNESIAMASNWADYIKSDPAYNYLYNWHFVDFERAYSYPEMVEFLNHDNSVNAYTKLNFLVGELKKKDLSKENKLLYLRMLIHITEDIHQPMHTAHASDKGGNDFKVTWFNKPTNLHSIWDTELINFQELSYTEYVKAINHPTAAQIKDWQSAPISKWVFESSQLAEKFYTEIKPDDKLGYKYNFDHLDILNQQLLKGGIRLAGLLNEIFG